MEEYASAWGKRKFCSREGCPNFVMLGGVCLKHVLQRPNYAAVMDVRIKRGMEELLQSEPDWLYMRILRCCIVWHVPHVERTCVISMGPRSNFAALKGVQTKPSVVEHHNIHGVSSDTSIPMKIKSCPISLGEKCVLLR
eukprot:scaffold18209_cov88-Skeletonema_dohrnii-CCMP3373.AAC.7